MEAYKKSFEVINALLDKGKGGRFTLKEVNEEIIKNGGILRVGIGVTIKSYLEELYWAGFLDYDNTGEELAYIVETNIIEEAEKISSSRKVGLTYDVKLDYE